MQRKLTGGFTLVEIMVVVLIIGLLLAIAVPTWVSRRQASRLSAVIGNLKAIESAKNRWAGDNGKGPADVPGPADLTPAYITQWPQTPFNNGADYSPNAVSSEATFKGVPLSNFQNAATVAAAINATGL